MKRLAKQLLSLFLLGTLVSSCATHLSYVSPCLTNPDEDYKDVVTIVGKAECFSKNAFINEPITAEIKTLPRPNVQPIVAVYKFQDL